MGRLKNSTKNLPAKAGIAAGGGSFSNHRPAVRALLYSSVLTGGLLLVNGAPAYAAPCTGGINGTNSTLCVIGTTNATLGYSPITAGNPLYVSGNFSLSLDDHDVNGATNGIEFSGVTGGDGFIELQDDSDVDGNNGSGITSSAVDSNTTIEVQDTSSVTGSVFGIRASSNGAGIGGNITINTQATTTVTGESFDGINANALAAGNITINAQGGVTGNGAGNVDGIFATANTGTIGVTTGTGAITGTDDGIEVFAVANTVTITTGTGLVTGTAGIGIAAEGNSVIVGAGGNVTGGAIGINANAITGTVSVTTAANTTVTGTGGNGINATATGAVTVDPDGNVSGGTNGINAVAQNGLVTVTTAVGATITGTNDDGINAEAQVTGNVVVTALSAVTGNDTGIDANAASGTVNVTTGAANVIANAGTGIDATASGAVTVNAGGNVTGTGGIGINAVAQNGNVDVDTAATFAVSGTTGAGIFANAAVTGNVDVNALSSVSGSTIGIDANATAGTVKVVTGTASVVGSAGNGIDATAAGAVSGVTVTAGGNVTGTGGAGIFAQGENGLVDIDTAAGFTVSGTSGAGIYAESTASGDVDVNAQSIVTGSTKGIDANASGGAVSVTTGTNAVTGNAGNGIEATAVGAVTVQAGGDVTGTGGTGILASSFGGNVNITTAAGTTVTGTSGQGIDASTIIVNGTVTVTNNATAQGSLAGIDAFSPISGGIQITNNFVVRNLSGNDFDLAIRTSGGATTIDNNGRLTGRVVTGALGDVLNNTSGWVTEGISDFGGGSDAVNNSFVILAGNDAGATDNTRFDNLENLNNNAGAIDLSEQSIGDGSNVRDTLSTSGNYAGNGGSLNVDAFLGGAGSLADVLDVDGAITGETSIFVVDTNPGAGGFDPAGILVVDGVAGNTAAERFVLDGGPIDKGLFTYDLLFDAAAGDHLLVGLPDREVFETLAAVSSAQEIFRETADAWSTRQENLRDTLAASQTITAVADPGVAVSDAPMGSLWVSALGSWAERDDDASFALLNANLEFDLSYNQDIYGVVGGADFRTSVGTDSSLLFGVMAGYVDSQLDFDEGGTSIDTNGATIGAYAALLSNGFFATILVKADLLDMDYSAAGDSDNADVASYGARGDFGYRFGDTLFFEPMLSVDGLSTKIDEFTIAGTDIDAGTNESFRAGAGLRVGYGGETIRASATARVWDVFATDNEVDILAGVPLGLSDDDLEGVYGDFSGQVDVSLSASTTVYLKGGILFSDDTTKPNASGGFAFYW